MDPVAPLAWPGSRRLRDLGRARWIRSQEVRAEQVVSASRRVSWDGRTPGEERGAGRRESRRQTGECTGCGRGCGAATKEPAVSVTPVLPSIRPRDPF